MSGEQISLQVPPERKEKKKKLKQKLREKLNYVIFFRQGHEFAHFHPNMKYGKT